MAKKDEIINESEKEPVNVEKDAQDLIKQAKLMQMIWDSLNEKEEKEGIDFFVKLKELANKKEGDSKPDIDKIIEHYKGSLNDEKNKELGPVNNLRLEIAQKIKNGEIENYAGLDAEVKKTVLDESKNVKKEFNKWYCIKNNDKKKNPKNFSIFHSFFTIPQEKSLKDKCENIKNYILNELCLEYDYQGNYSAFGGDRNFGSTQVFYKFWPKSIEDHKDAIQLTLCIKSDGIFVEEMAGSIIADKEKVKELNLTQENDESEDDENE